MLADMSDTHTRPGLPEIDVSERGGKRDGVEQRSQRRMFFQVLVLDAPDSDGDALVELLTARLTERRIPSVVYADVASPSGFGLATWSEDPTHFVTKVRPLFSRAVGGALAGARVRDGWQMLGRTYSQGHEPELEFALLERPVRNLMNPAMPWHVWYPLRRTGPFSRLEPHDQSVILREHASLGMAYGQAELAHDIRLACHGIDAGDNEFVIGLVGPTLHPLSHLVQAMRKTRQTAEFVAKMGPFFVGHVAARVAA